MGRLLRKKTVKKKKTEADAVSGIRTGENTAAPAPPDPQKNTLSRKPPAVPGRNTLVEKALQFLREVRAEYRKVTWPSRKQTLGSTIVVIVVVMIISAFLGMMDMGLSGLIRMVLQ